MGLESFGKKAKNAIRAAVLGGSIAATPAPDASARDMWAKPPIPPADAMERAGEEFKAIQTESKRVMEESKRTMDQSGEQFRAIQAESERVMGESKRTMEQLRTQSRDFGKNPAVQEMIRKEVERVRKEEEQK